MRRFLTLVCLMFLALPVGITISGCTRNPAGNYCNGLGYGLKTTDVAKITLQPETTGISMAFGQTRQVSAPTATNCKGGAASVTGYVYGTSNNKLVDISPSGNICAGTWNRNSGGGIADYTICNFPVIANGSPYATAAITATGQSVVSNPVTVYVHAQVSSLNLVGPTSCLSQGTLYPQPLDVQAFYSNSGTQTLLCAPNSTAVPNCSSAIGTLTYSAGNTTIASINAETNQITAQLPGTTVITASVAGSGSSAGYFSTCPPESISLKLNGKTSGTVTQGVAQNLVTTVTDTNGNPITGLTLDYQSTNPQDISAGSTGSITANFPGAASVYAICQPSSCNPSPINQVGVFGTGLPISSNAVDITTPGTASSYVWYSAPGHSQYFVPVQLLSGTVGSTVRLPYVPNSMVMDQSGSNLYFGSSHELMIYSTASNTLSTQNTGTPGVVLAVAPNNSAALVNDQVRQVFYIIGSSGGTVSTFGGVGSAAQWTPDSKTLYITDSAALGAGHSDTLYVYDANTGWTSCSAGKPCAADFKGAENLALMIPGVGAYLSGNPTVARTWCPAGPAGDYANTTFYPQGDSVPAQTDVLTATTDGAHVLGAAAIGGGVTLSDIGVAIPAGACPASAGLLEPLTLTHTLAQTPVNVNATSINQIVTSPAAVSQGTAGAAYSLTFITYNGNSANAPLPYYKQITGATSALGTLGYLTLAGSSAITAPVAGAFSPDNALFFVSTAGDNKIHYIDTTTLQDTQQISPNLPACNPNTDAGCTLPAPTTQPVPATAITVKPRSTT